MEIEEKAMGKSHGISNEETSYETQMRKAMGQ